jgi:hypothetical protein
MFVWIIILSLIFAFILINSPINEGYNNAFFFPYFKPYYYRLGLIYPMTTNSEHPYISL